MSGSGRAERAFPRWPIAAAVLLVAAAPPEPRHLVLEAQDGPFVTAIINGVPLRLKVEFDEVPGVTLNPEAATLVGLEKGGRWVERIGPVTLRGWSRESPLALAGAPTTATIRWRDRPAASEADGAVSVHSLPFDSVTLNRGPSAAAERDLSFAISVNDNHGVHFPIRVGRERIAVRFSLSRPRTTAPGAAAAIIAEQRAGRLENERGQEEIVPGVQRPVRPLRLGSPLEVGELAVPVLMARTSDFRGGHELNWTHEAVSDGEIVVTGQGESQEALYRITLGLDVLGRCSSATYRRATAQLQLRCAQD